MKPSQSQGMLSVDEALAALLAGARPLDAVETISTMDATGRVLARPVRSTIDVPEADNTAMDGYAVRAADCTSGAARLRVTQRIPAGAVGRPLEPGTAARIFTGAPIPPGADAVVMQEMTEADGDAVLVKAKPEPGEWIRRTGEDIRRDSTILEPGLRLRPQATGLAASVGVGELTVYRRFRVGIFFTGDELLMPGEPLAPGKIYNSSRYTLTSMMRELGCTLTDYGIVPDTLEATRATLRRAAAENDLVLTSGGVSVGEEDHVKPAVEAEGRLDLWKIAMKPGKPLAFGQVRRADGTESAFIGLPGNPVSSLVCLMLFVRPFVLRSQGVTDVMPHAYAMRADFDWPKADARQEFLRARINAGGGLDLFPNQSSAVLTSTVWGDGLIDNPPRQPIRRGDTVRFLPFDGLMR
jgi:molybdopterin molybdotransferase